MRRNRQRQVLSEVSQCGFASWTLRGDTFVPGSLIRRVLIAKSRSKTEDVLSAKRGTNGARFLSLFVGQHPAKDRSAKDKATVGCERTALRFCECVDQSGQWIGTRP